VLDAAELERRGVATATIVTQEFVTAGREHAQNFGIPDYPLAVIAHPIANRGPEELRRMADAAWDQVLAALAGRPAS
jgi:hypothetical protein